MEIIQWIITRQTLVVETRIFLPIRGIENREYHEYRAADGPVNTILNTPCSRKNTLYAEESHIEYMGTIHHAKHNVIVFK